MQPSFRKTTALLAGAIVVALGSAANTAFADPDAGTPTVTTPAPSTPAPEAPAPKETPVAPAPMISVSGEIDGYYQYQFENPKDTTDITGRIYAFRHNTPTVRLAWVDIAHAAKPGEFGFKVSLATGDAADRDIAPGGGEEKYKNLAQIYGTYASKGGITVDAGKFLSPYGYDTTEAILNYNYTLTLATYLVPNYLGGIRATVPFKNLAVSAFVVNDLEETATSGIQEDNNHKDFILRLNYTSPDGKLNYIPAVGVGRDKLGGPLGKGNEDVILWDNWLTYHVTPKITLAGEYVYRKDKDKGGLYNLRGDGYGFYYRQQLDSKNAIALRYSALAKHTEDVSGFPSSTSSFRADEETATFEQKVASNFTVRYEFRHDHSNNASLFGFVDSDGNITKSDQNAALVAGIFTF